MQRELSKMINILSDEIRDAVRDLCKLLKYELIYDTMYRYFYISEHSVEKLSIHFRNVLILLEATRVQTLVKGVDEELECMGSIRFFSALPAQLEKMKKEPQRGLMYLLGPWYFKKKKQDGSLRLCMDYQALNKVTVKNNYPIPFIANLFNQLSCAKYFSKLDLRLSYHQVRVIEGNESKTTYVTRYGVFKFLVMPFGRTNAPANFCTLMDQVFHDYLDKVLYKARKVNRVANAHSKRLKFTTLRVITPMTASKVTTDIREKWTLTNKRTTNLCPKSKGAKAKVDVGMPRYFMEWASTLVANHFIFKTMVLLASYATRCDGLYQDVSYLPIRQNREIEIDRDA
ncbi:Uncharacterized protein TCM_040236 [Theobroma cacao]|uniref:Reverse transcriptase domain-containing protein n=1 Tax=Theobroma cacao TaxID=3641 RepID=A0A061GR88_THECC|nr:Uncharacterized protein TCM_040236 [Theobroma cacao]